MEFEDKTLTCKECGTNFIWTTGEQEFYQQRGLTNQPGRCGDCRAARKASGGGYGGGGGGGGYASSGPREMFEATCTDCGNMARVPFQPTPGKAVRCSSCFEAVRGAGNGTRGGERRSY